MKKNVIIIFLFAISILMAETIEVNKQLNGPRRPLYEKFPIIKDYRINQPIKGAIRWGTVGSVVGYAGAIIYLKSEGNNSLSQSNKATNIFGNTIIFSVVTGTLHGVYKGFMAQNKQDNDPSYYIKQNNLGYEGNAMIDPFVSSDAIMNKITKSIALTYDHQYRFIDEFQFGIGWIRWPDLQETRHVYEETKYNLKGIHYYRKGYIFSPYYGLGGGLSYGKRRHDEWYYDDQKILSSGIYPFIHTSAGVRFSVLDFFYLKVETDFELSSFYLFARSHEDFSFLTNLTFGLVIGTKIF